MYFDPGNNYSIPFNADYWCIGYDKRFYPQAPPASWDLIFNNQTGAPKVGMTNDARESVLLTAKYLFGTTDDLNKNDIEKLSQFLRDQKPRVAAYTDLRADYLISSGTAQAAVSQTAFIIRSMWDNSSIGLLIPPKTFVLIDSLVIPKMSQKDDLVYQFINYLYRPDVIKHHWEKYATIPSTTDFFVKEILSPYGILDLNWKNISFIRSTLSNETINKIWLDLKSY